MLTHGAFGPELETVLWLDTIGFEGRNGGEVTRNIRLKYNGILSEDHDQWKYPAMSWWYHPPHAV